MPNAGSYGPGSPPARAFTDLVIKHVEKLGDTDRLSMNEVARLQARATDSERPPQFFRASVTFLVLPPNKGSWSQIRSPD